MSYFAIINYVFPVPEFILKTSANAYPSAQPRVFVVIPKHENSSLIIRTLSVGEKRGRDYELVVGVVVQVCAYNCVTKRRPNLPKFVTWTQNSGRKPLRIVWIINKNLNKSKDAKSNQTFSLNTLFSKCRDHTFNNSSDHAFCLFL